MFKIKCYLSILNIELTFNYSLAFKAKKSRVVCGTKFILCPSTHINAYK